VGPQKETMPRRGHPVVVSVLVVAASMGSAVLALAAFADCDVGVNQGANLLSVAIIGFPVLTTVNALAVLGVGGVVRRTLRSTDSSKWWAFVAQVALLCLSAYLCWRYLATPADYPSPRCQKNVPPWTPSWLPS
jgi:hypothetical protein